MTIFLRELKRNRKSFLIWTVILVLYNIMIFAMYPSLADQAELYQKMLEGMPKELMAAFNIGQMDFSNIISYYGTYSYLYLLMFGSIYAMLLGAGILSKEESDKTIEFLLAKPVTRNLIVGSKMGCAFLYIFLFDLLFSVSTFALVEVYHESAYSLKALILLSVGALLVFYLFAAVGMLISIFIVKAKSIYPIAIGAVMGTFILGSIGKISEKAEGLKYLSPFEYVDANYILTNERIDPTYLAIFAIVIISSVVLTYVLYNKKDITV